MNDPIDEAEGIVHGHTKGMKLEGQGKFTILWKGKVHEFTFRAENGEELCRTVGMIWGIINEHK